jgi:ribonuclease H2 subunit A
LSAEYLSSEMLSEKKVSLNVISENSAIKLIEGFINKGYNVRNAYLDTVGGPDAYRKLLEQHFAGKNIRFTVTSKADSLFKVVSAASIVAKVNRDLSISEWKFRENIQPDLEFNSGYPGDAQTVAWLKRNVDRVMGLPSLVRYSWSTTDNLLKTMMVAKENYTTELLVSNDLLDSYGLLMNKSFRALISKHKLYRNVDEILTVSGRFEL